MGPRRFLSVGLSFLVLGSLTATSRHQRPGQRPQDGAVGGPYKVIAADFTGDRLPDLLLSYEPSDALTLERGDGRGRFSSAAVFQIPYDGRPHIDPVYNMAHGDIDGDGLPDLAVALGGPGQHGDKTSFPG